MEKRTYRIIWPARAQKQMLAVHRYIAQDSLREANKVLDEIEHIVDGLPRHPKKYPADKFCRKKDDSYRAFEKHHCRVTYRILKTEIRIVQVRHTSRNPRYY